MEETWILRGICLLAGALFGAATGIAQELARFCKAAGHTGRDARRTPRRVRLLADVMKTAAVCALCHAALAPEMEESAALYAGAGALLGHFCAERKNDSGERAAAVVCTWVAFYLPVTGLVCVLAGLVVALGTGKLSWGVALVPALAAPAAWLQFDGQGSLFMAAAFLLLAWYGKAASRQAYSGKMPLPSRKSGK